ncbi:MAG TPA: inositol monophosphatase family protein [Actinomycetota bacterium]|jgi:myo-inositol-1(or 4)-monophosphatase
MIEAPELARLRAVAAEAAEAGADVVRRRAGESAPEAEAKGRGDYVTAVDRESEETVRAALERATPGIPVLGEEGGGGGGDTYWAVDPLDGTTNFLLGFPVVGVSIALVSGGRPAAAAVRAPLLGLAFTAAREQGAWSGERRLAVSGRPASRAVVATGFPFRAKQRLPRYLRAMTSVLERVEDLRRPGAASLDLAWVAAGVFDGFFELGLAVWDVAAGALLVEEAGGIVTDWDGGPGYLGGNILAGSPATHRVLAEAAETR